MRVQRFVFDASPLIHLTKAGLSRLIVDLEGEKYTVPAVIGELIKKGKELDYPGAAITESLVEQGTLRVKAPPGLEVDRITRLHKDIHAGESEVIALAREMSAIGILDDRVARAVAKIHGVRVEGSYGVVLRATAKGLISAEEAEEALRALVTSGWRCDAELFAALLVSVRHLSDGQASKQSRPRK